MKIKLVVYEITNCCQCPSLSLDSVTCHATGREIPEVLSIPAWCPRPDAGDGKESRTRLV